MVGAYTPMITAHQRGERSRTVPSTGPQRRFASSSENLHFRPSQIYICTHKNRISISLYICKIFSLCFQGNFTVDDCPLWPLQPWGGLRLDPLCRKPPSPRRAGPEAIPRRLTERVLQEAELIKYIMFPDARNGILPSGLCRREKIPNPISYKVLI